MGVPRGLDIGMSGDLDLGRGQHRRLVPGARQGGEVDRLDPPAVVLEDAPERRRALDVAGQADRGRVEVGGDRDLGLLEARQDRRDGQVVAEGLAAPPVDVADGGADLGVGVGVDVFLEEVDEPAVALEDGQDPEVGAAVGALLEQALDSAREVRLGPALPERDEAEDEGIQGCSPEPPDWARRGRIISKTTQSRPEPSVTGRPVEANHPETCPGPFQGHWWFEDTPTPTLPRKGGGPE